ncbi:hypothetical protein GGR92_001934 [Spirosoma lacussanchae]
MFYLAVVLTILHSTELIYRLAISNRIGQCYNEIDFLCKLHLSVQ